MKIIQVIPAFGLAGAEIMCENLIYELIKLNHNVTVISLYDYESAITNRLKSKGVEVRYLGKKLGLDFSMFIKLKKIFDEIRPDVVHTHLYSAQYAIPIALLRGVKKIVHTVHNIASKENGKYGRKLNNLFFKYFRVIPVALSDLVKSSIISEYNIAPNMVPVIFNGIDLSKCIPKSDYSITGDFKILHIARFSEQKNHITLVKAFKLFYDKYPNSELWLIGDGDKKQQIEEYVLSNNLSTCIKFLGLRDNIYEFLHDADIFTLPSNYEGVPMTLIEAMGTGLPIVATSVGGVPDMLHSQKNSILVENNVESIFQAFEDYYINEKKRAQHGVSAKERANLFSATLMAQNYENLYLE